MARTTFGGAAAFIVICGCGGPPGPVPVKAVVKIDGQPAEGVNVTFHWAGPPTTPPEANSGSGLTDATGTVVAKSMSGGKGLVPGPYKVTFTRMVDGKGKPAPLKPDKSPGVVRDAMPTKYRSKASTDVSITVPEQGLDTVLELTSK
jgi:hypothetical protein